MSARQRARLLQSKQLAAIAGDDSSDAEDDYQVKRKPRKQKKAPAPAFSLPIGSSDEDDSDASRDSDKEDEGSASPKDDTNFTSAVPERQPSNDSIFEDSSDDESPAVLVQKPSTFTQLIDSSSSSDDDTDDVPLQQIAATAPVNKKKSAVLSSVEQTTDDQDAAAFLEEQIRKNEELQAAIAADESNAVNRRKACEDSESILFTKIDPKQLNWDNIVRNRFGGGGLGDLNVNDVGNNQRNAPTRGNRMFSHRRWLFGQPDDDWGKPPSIIGGGMGMTRLHTEYLPGSTTKEILYNVFTFKWSKEYHKLATLYQIAKATGDPNYLVMFLANYPYYAEGFIDLGYIFFQMGLVERGLQCFRRVLYLYECASMEAFRPHLGQSRLLMTSDASLATKKAQPSSSNGSDDGSGRDEDEFDFDERSDDEGDVDSLRDELNANEDNDDAQFADDEPNRVYLRALWRFLQAVNMQGQIPLAANLATMILALNPTDDVVHILLSLDYFLLQAGKYSEVTRMCGMALEPTTLGEVRAMQRRKNNSDDNSSSDSSDDESSPAVSAEDQRKRIVDLVQHHWHRAYVIHKPSSPSSTAAEAHDGGGSLHTAYAVDKLPNWWFSAALAVHLSVLERELARQYDATASPEPELTSLLWSRSTADTLLQQALRRWPSVGWELFIRNYTQQDTLSASGVHSGHLYERMKLLGFYFTATSTTSAVATVLQPPPLEAHEEHIIQCFLTRCAQSAQLWARREVWSWFVANLERTATAIEAIVTLTNDTNTTPAVVAEAVTAFHRFYGGSDRPTPMDPSMPALEGEAANPLVKYSTAELTDFEAEIPRLRLEGVQPIDAQLMEERVLAGGVKFKKLDKHLLSMKSQLQWRKVQGRWIAAQEEHHRAAAFAGAPQDQPENNNANDSNSTLNRMFDMTLPVALVLFLISLVFWLVMVWRNARQVTSP